MFDLLSDDPLISSLREYGYNAIRLPRANIKPLQVLIKKEKVLFKIGDLSTLFKTENHIAVPKIKENIQVSDVSGRRSGDLSLGVGLSLVGNILSAFGGSSSGLDSAYQQTKTVSFEYEDVLEDRIEVLELEQFLNNADMNDPFSRQTAELLESDGVYLIASTIKSKKLQSILKHLEVPL